MSLYLTELFEADPGYDNDGWTENVQSGNTLDEDYDTSLVPGGAPSGWGSQCLQGVKGSNPEANARRDLPAKNTSFFRFEVMIDAATSASVEAALFETWNTWPGGSRLFSINLGAAGNTITVRVWHDGSDNLVYTHSISLDTVYVIEGKWDINTNTWEVKIDGQTKASGTITGSPSSTWYTDRTFIGPGYYVAGSAPNFTVLYDLLDFDDSAWVVSGIPSPPTDLVATPGDSKITLDWDASPGATSYNIKRSETQGGPYSTIKSGNLTNSYVDLTAVNGTMYYYVVTAVNSYGESGNSNEASGTPAANTAAVNVGAPARTLLGTFAGGKEWYVCPFTIEATKDLLSDAGITPYWQIGRGTNDYGYRWDDRSAEAGSTYRSYASNVKFVVAEAEDAGVSLTDIRDDETNARDGVRYAELIKGSGDVNARYRIYNNDSGDPLPRYYRADVQLKTFNATANAALLWVTDTGATDWVVDIRSDRKLEYGGVAGTTILALDTWYVIEMRITSGNVDIYLNGSPEITGGSAPTNIKNYRFGFNGANSDGKIWFDALRVDSSAMPTLQDPWDYSYIAYETFDADSGPTPRTLDEQLKAAEGASAFVIVDIPTPRYIDGDMSGGENSTHGYTWQTAQYYADMVQYINGDADPDWADKQPTDYDHTPGNTDNWANLRAFRGRVAKYDVTYFTVGFEPYFIEWGNNVSGYSTKWAEYRNSIKTKNPSVKIGLPLRWNGALSWNETLVQETNGLFDFVNAYHWYSGFGINEYEAAHSGWWIAGNDAYDKASRAKIDRTIGDVNIVLQQNGLDPTSFEKVVTEFGFTPSGAIGEGDELGHAMHVASRLMIYARDGADRVGLFTINTEANRPKSFIAVASGAIKPPNYYALEMFNNLQGLPMIIPSVTSDEYNYVNTQFVGDVQIPYVSALAAKDSVANELHMIIVHRDQSSTRVCTINLTGGDFTPASGEATELKSASVYDENMTPTGPTSIPGVGLSFDYTLQPNSITYIKLSGTVEDQNPDPPPAGPQYSLSHRRQMWQMG